jgi:hypothetical protein
MTSASDGGLSSVVDEVVLMVVDSVAVSASRIIVTLRVKLL